MKLSDLLTSKSTPFILVPNCIELVKLPQAVYKTSTNKLLVYDHGRTHEQPENRMPPAPALFYR